MSDRNQRLPVSPNDFPNRNLRSPTYSAALIVKIRSRGSIVFMLEHAKLR